jgi:hypothetical protein
MNETVVAPVVAQRRSAAKPVLAGSLAGFTGFFGTLPFDFVKQQLQSGQPFPYKAVKAQPLVKVVVVDVAWTWRCNVNACAAGDPRQHSRRALTLTSTVVISRRCGWVHVDRTANDAQICRQRYTEKQHQQFGVCERCVQSCVPCSGRPDGKFNRFHCGLR